MSDLPEHLFANPAMHALQTRHRDFARSAGDAMRYQATVAPFAALVLPTKSAWEQLRGLMALGESVWIFESDPHLHGLVLEDSIECLQMVLPPHIEPQPSAHEIVSLKGADAEMVALTDLAFPGFFRSRTGDMGSYYGVRSNGELIAMGGERLKLHDYFEISGVCTHSAYRGKGLAAGIIWRIVQDHRRQGITSWLHVGAENRNAIQLYLRMGFVISRKITVNRISRQA